MALLRKETHEIEPEAVGRLAPWTGWLAPWWEPFKTAVEGVWIPVEEFEEDGVYTVRAELPGIDPEKDVEITVQDGLLAIRAERRQEAKVEEPRFLRSEIRYGAFSRTLPLPQGCTEADITAEYRDGILTVRLPVTHEPATRIPVARG
jgi:HSP20 family protein